MFLKKLSRKLSKVYGKRVRVLGVYVWKATGRKLVDVCWRDKRKTQLLARVKLEIKLKRRLRKGETVDHIDENPLNDKSWNLQALSQKENSAKSIWKVIPDKVSCVECESEFVPTKDQRGRRAKSKSGPFCSRVCSGRYGSRVRYTGITTKRVPIETRYAR